MCGRAPGPLVASMGAFVVMLLALTFFNSFRAAD